MMKLQFFIVLLLPMLFSMTASAQEKDEATPGGFPSPAPGGDALGPSPSEAKALSAKEKVCIRSKNLVYPYKRGERPRPRGISVFQGALSEKELEEIICNDCEIECKERGHKRGCCLATRRKTKEETKGPRAERPVGFPIAPPGGDLGERPQYGGYKKFEWDWVCCCSLDGKCPRRKSQGAGVSSPATGNRSRSSDYSTGLTGDRTIRAVFRDGKEEGDRIDVSGFFNEYRGIWPEKDTGKGKADAIPRIRKPLDCGSEDGKITDYQFLVFEDCPYVSPGQQCRLIHGKYDLATRKLVYEPTDNVIIAPKNKREHTGTGIIATWLETSPINKKEKRPVEIKAQDLKAVYFCDPGDAFKIDFDDEKLIALLERSPREIYKEQKGKGLLLGSPPLDLDLEQQDFVKASDVEIAPKSPTPKNPETLSWWVYILLIAFVLLLAAAGYYFRRAIFSFFERQIGILKTFVRMGRGETPFGDYHKGQEEPPTAKQAEKTSDPFVNSPWGRMPATADQALDWHYGIPPGTTVNFEKVKMAYKRLAANIHNDVNDSEEATKRMQILNRGFDLIKKVYGTNR